MNGFARFRTPRFTIAPGTRSDHFHRYHPTVVHKFRRSMAMCEYGATGDLATRVLEYLIGKSSNNLLTK